MKALATQFDDKRLSTAVATPTCSSCCCCCCCLATSISSSILLSQRVAREGEKHQVPDRHLYTVLAALFVPISAALTYFGFWMINHLFRTCHFYQPTYSYSNGYTICANPGSSLILPLMILAPFLVLWFLYTKVHVQKPVLRALLITAVIAAAFTAEFFTGAFLILTGIGGPVYLVIIPFVVGAMSIFYHKHLMNEERYQLAVQQAAVEAAQAQPAATNPETDANDSTQPLPPTPSA